MKIATLCFLLDKENILLAMKKRGFGVGKWNGIGGKVQENETLEQAAIREMQEEIGVISRTEHLEKKGDIKFYFKNNPDWNMRVHVFFVKNWEGEPRESEEMRPQWYKQSEIPFEEMWSDDPHWLPRVLEGKNIEGEFYFDEGGENFEKFDLKEI